MFSIVVCSQSLQRLQKLEANISETIGIAFELLAVDNSKSQHSICSAYNSAASRAAYPYICFVHEDVEFVSKNWGLQLLEHLKDESIGLLGIAGNTYKSKIPTTWPQSVLQGIETKRINIIQHYKRSEKTEEHVILNPLNEVRSEVVNLDGVLLITRKSVWQQYKFDETLLKGFHGYDLDYSLKVGQSHKLYVIYDVLIQHFSEGECEANCILDYISLHKKWQQKLPVLCQPYSIDKSSTYKFSWEKLNKHTRSFIKSNKSLAFSFNQYCRMVTLVDKRPSVIQFYRDVVVHWLGIIRYYFWYKRNLVK